MTKINQWEKLQATGLTPEQIASKLGIEPVITTDIPNIRNSRLNPNQLHQIVDTDSPLASIMEIEDIIDERTEAELEAA